MPVGQGPGYVENPDYVPLLTDEDHRSAIPEDAIIGLPEEYKQHPPFVTGNIDTTSASGERMPDPLATLPPADEVADVPEGGYPPKPEDTPEVTPEARAVTTEESPGGLKNPADMTVDELKAEASGKVPGFSQMLKDDLVAAVTELRAKEANP